MGMADEGEISAVVCDNGSGVVKVCLLLLTVRGVCRSPLRTLHTSCNSRARPVRLCRPALLAMTLREPSFLLWSADRDIKALWWAWVRRRAPRLFSRGCKLVPPVPHLLFFCRV